MGRKTAPAATAGNSALQGRILHPKTKALQLLATEKSDPVTALQQSFYRHCCHI